MLALCCFFLLHLPPSLFSPSFPPSFSLLSCCFSPPVCTPAAPTLSSSSSFCHLPQPLKALSTVPHLRSTAGRPPRPCLRPRPPTPLPARSPPPPPHPQPHHSGSRPPASPPRSVQPSTPSCLTTPRFPGDSRPSRKPRPQLPPPSHLLHLSP